MSDDQIATALGQILGELHSHRDEFRRYVELHDRRHSEERVRLDAHAAVVDGILATHAADINQAKGAKAAVLLIASGLAAAISFLGKKVF